MSSWRLTGGLSLVLMFLFRLQEHQKFLRLLTDTENWLYEEGEDQAKQAYVDKLDELMVGPAGPGALAAGRHRGWSGNRVIAMRFLSENWHSHQSPLSGSRGTAPRV